MTGVIDADAGKLTGDVKEMLMAAFGYGNPMNGLMGSFALIVIFLATSALSAGATLFLVLIMLHIFFAHLLRLMLMPWIGDPLPGPEE